MNEEAQKACFAKREQEMQGKCRIRSEAQFLDVFGKTGIDAA